MHALPMLLPFKMILYTDAIVLGGQKISQTLQRESMCFPIYQLEDPILTYI